MIVFPLRRCWPCSIVVSCVLRLHARIFGGPNVHVHRWLSTFIFSMAQRPISGPHYTRNEPCARLQSHSRPNHNNDSSHHNGGQLHHLCVHKNHFDIPLDEHVLADTDGRKSVDDSSFNLVALLPFEYQLIEMNQVDGEQPPCAPMCTDSETAFGE